MKKTEEKKIYFFDIKLQIYIVMNRWYHADAYGYHEIHWGNQNVLNIASQQHLVNMAHDHIKCARSDMSSLICVFRIKSDSKHALHRHMDAKLERIHSYNFPEKKPLHFIHFSTVIYSCTQHFITKSQSSTLSTLCVWALWV